MGRLAKGNLHETHPQISKLLLNQNDGIQYTYGTNTKVWWICPECGHKMYRSVSKVVSRGLKCEICSDGISVGEKIIYNILKIYSDSIQKEKIFNWAKNKKYDFYIEDLNIICEVFGSQHYQEEFSRIKSERKARTYEEEHENDLLKERLAKENCIDKYVIINTSNEDLEYLKNSILNSELKNIFDLSIIDWNNIFLKSLKSKAIESCELWNAGYRSTREISEMLNISISVVIKYLKKCNKIGLCDYDSYKIRCSQYVYGNEAVRKKIVCVNTGQVFNSLKDAKDYFSISSSHICNCAKGNRTYAGIDKNTGEYLVWKYFDDYDKNKHYEIPKEKPHRKPKEIICLNNNKIFTSTKEAAKYIGLKSGDSIRRVCNKKAKYAGKFKNEELATWMYYEEYRIKALE